MLGNAHCSSGLRIRPPVPATPSRSAPQATTKRRRPSRLSSGFSYGLPYFSDVFHDSITICSGYGL